MKAIIIIAVLFLLVYTTVGIEVNINRFSIKIIKPRGHFFIKVIRPELKMNFFIGIIKPEDLQQEVYSL